MHVHEALQCILGGLIYWPCEVVVVVVVVVVVAVVVQTIGGACASRTRVHLSRMPVTLAVRLPGPDPASMAVYTALKNQLPVTPSARCCGHTCKAGCRIERQGRHGQASYRTLLV